MIQKFIDAIRTVPNYRNAMLIFLLSIIFTTVCEIKVIMDRNKPPIEYIHRGKDGDLIVNENLSVTVDGVEKNIKLEVNPQEYEYAELEILWEELSSLMPNIMRHGRMETSAIDYDLAFPLEVDGYPFLLTYMTSNEDYISKQGKLGCGMNDEGSLVTITVTAKTNSPVFKAEREYNFKVVPKDSYDSFIFRLKKYLMAEEQKNKSSEEIKLPGSFEGKNIIWKKTISDKSMFIFLIGCVASIALIIGKKEDDTKQKKRIQNAMEIAYPEMVTRLAMYMGAGMTITAAFNRMAEICERETKRRNPLQEQIIITKREMEAGISEMEAMKNLAVRCKISQISRLSALIVQGSRRGSMGIRSALKEETKQALIERKAKALILGEQAGTKLLIPMMMMLIMVMGIIIIPAFTSFAL